MRTASGEPSPFGVRLQVGDAAASATAVNFGGGFAGLRVSIISLCRCSAAAAPLQRFGSLASWSKALPARLGASSAGAALAAGILPSQHAARRASQALRNGLAAAELEGLYTSLITPQLGSQVEHGRQVRAVLVVFLAVGLARPSPGRPCFELGRLTAHSVWAAHRCAA